jgi:2-hydroxy-3-keto-5-methylthiopentenyl-1-phosphate phosphatase
VGWLLDVVTVRPGLAEIVAEHGPLVVSAGFHELIEPVLEREGVTVELVANRLEQDGDGWRTVFLERPACPVCGEPCKRMALRDIGPYTFVGDGVSDRCASLAADRVFARDGLARWLDENGVAYEPFADLNDVRAAL